MEKDGHPERRPSNQGYCVGVPKTTPTFKDPTGRTQQITR